MKKIFLILISLLLISCTPQEIEKLIEVTREVLVTEIIEITKEIPVTVVVTATYTPTTVFINTPMPTNTPLPRNSEDEIFLSGQYNVPEELKPGTWLYEKPENGACEFLYYSTIDADNNMNNNAINFLFGESKGHVEILQSYRSVYILNACNLSYIEE